MPCAKGLVPAYMLSHCRQYDYPTLSPLAKPAATVRGAQWSPRLTCPPCRRERSGSDAAPAAASEPAFWHRPHIASQLANTVLLCEASSFFVLAFFLTLPFSLTATYNEHCDNRYPVDKSTDRASYASE